jgi:SAM-dependent methyltransferase
MGITRLLSLSLLLALSLPHQQKPFEPYSGQPGKDVVWVPTSPALVEKMLDLAKVTPQDYVIDLGSGDGRNVIAAAKRGARGHGVEFNPDMVELSRRLAREAGVAEKATFIEGDMYEADISKASVLALFLLPTNLEKLKDKFLALKPGSRIVLNTFLVDGWEPDVSERLENNCDNWCLAALYIVPAKVAGTWQFQGGEVVLDQHFQKLSGTLTSARGAKTSIADGLMKGAEITFSADGYVYTGKVDGDRITGTATRTENSQRQTWTATKRR